MYTRNQTYGRPLGARRFVLRSVLAAAMLSTFTSAFALQPASPCRRQSSSIADTMLYDACMQQSGATSGGSRIGGGGVPAQDPIPEIWPPSFPRPKSSGTGADVPTPTSGATGGWPGPAKPKPIPCRIDPKTKKRDCAWREL